MNTTITKIGGIVVEINANKPSKEAMEKFNRLLNKAIKTKEKGVIR
ncbi:MAG TPA: hypothetical protein VFF20_08275 [Pseudogracilibacillus sp.]|nr:hypothetical protein [Pseudogracilibacillus sp.]